MYHKIIGSILQKITNFSSVKETEKPKDYGDPHLHASNAVRSMVYAYAQKTNQAVLQWGSDVTAVRAYGCEFYQCVFSNESGVLVRLGHYWKMVSDTAPSLLEDEKALLDLARPMYLMKDATLGNVLADKKGQVRMVTEQGVSDLQKQGLLIQAFGPVSSHYANKKQIATADFLAVDSNGNEMKGAVLWSQTQCVFTRPGKPGELFRVTPVYEWQDKGEGAKNFFEELFVFKNYIPPTELLGDPSKNAPRIFYVTPPANRRVQEVVAPDTPEQARRIANDKGVIVPRRGSYLPKRTHKGRGRPNVMVTQTNKGLFFVVAKLGKGSSQITVYFHQEEDAVVLIHKAHNHGSEGIYAPSREDMARLINTIGEALGHFDKLKGKVSGRFLRFAQAYANSKAAIEQQMWEMAETNCANAWKLAEERKAKAILIKTIPVGALVALSDFDNGQSFHWAIKGPKPEIRPERFGFLADSSRLPSIEDVQRYGEFQKWSAHMVLENIEALSEIERYIAADESLDLLRPNRQKPHGSTMSFAPSFFNDLKLYRPNSMVAKQESIGTVYGLDVDGPYRYGYQSGPYQPYARPWTAENVTWQSGTIKKPARFVNTFAYDVFVHNDERLFCSQKAKTVLESLQVSQVSFWPTKQQPNLYYVHVEEEKDDFHDHPAFVANNRYGKQFSTLSRRYSLDMGLSIKPSGLVGADVWRSGVVRRDYVDTQIFMFSERVMTAFTQKKVKLGPVVALPVTKENPYDKPL